VGVDIERFLIKDDKQFELFENVNGKLVEKSFQIENGYISRIWWILDGTTKAGNKREFFLYENGNSNHENIITADVTSNDIILLKNNREILHYQTSAIFPPVGVDTIYKRSGFIHPLISPGGNVLTRIYPPDHYHHFGIWNPWTRVKIGDHITDFWNLAERQGTVMFSGINSVEIGPVYGGFSVKQDHIDFLGNSSHQLALNEIWDVRAWNAEPLPNLNSYLVDLTTFLSVAGDDSIIFQDYRYGGGIGIRASEEWNRNNSYVLTSEGKTREDADGTKARWVDINGQFKNKGQSGIVFFSYPKNREHPEPMRVWPIDANDGRGDMFFEFCPVRNVQWVLDTGKAYRLKYRMLVYDGNIDAGTADRLWNDFAYPPEVKTITK